MAFVPDEHADKVASPTPEANPARENSLRVTTAQTSMDVQQTGRSWMSRQIGLRNDLRHTPVHVEHRRSIQPDNKYRRSDKK
jgi:hypothetical protein